MMVLMIVMKRITIMKFFSRTGFKQIWRSKIFSMQPIPQRIRLNFGFCITLFVFDLLSWNKFTFLCCPSSKSFQQNCPNETIHYSLCIVKVQVVMLAKVSDSEAVFTSLRPGGLNGRLVTSSQRSMELAARWPFFLLGFEFNCELSSTFPK